MYPTHWIPIWIHAPFIRVLPPLIAGILLQWYLPMPVLLPMVLVTTALPVAVFVHFMAIEYRHRWLWLQGIAIHVCLFVLGIWLVRQSDDRHTSTVSEKNQQSVLNLILLEKPVQKAHSQKVMVAVTARFDGKQWRRADEKVLLYLSDSSGNGLDYGDELLMQARLQPIQNAGNPGAFDYRQYCAFQQCYQTAYVKPVNWKSLHRNSGMAWKRWIFNCRESVLQVLRTYVTGGPEALGIAEALLIGYGNDLDKDLVQAYSNTGVVHIIAISGMHLGLIYVMLVWLFARVPGIKQEPWLQAVLILCCLWMFSLMTGASASVLRSAVMFSCIVVGKLLNRHSSIYNSLGASAFLLLCYHPFYVWDVGFQLSYFAIVGIVLFQQKIYRAVYIRQKWINEIWKLTSVSLAAQVLTFPICLYYFHQFPNLFLLSNLIAVPLSSIVLFAEIGLLLLSFIPLLGHGLGYCCGALLQLMNGCIRFINQIPCSVWEPIPATVVSTLLLYATVIGLTAFWLLPSYKKMLCSLLLVLGWTASLSWSDWRYSQQLRLIVYKVPKHSGMDIVSGHQYQFVGDSILESKGILRQFHLKPTRTLWQMEAATHPMSGVFRNGNFIQLGHLRIGQIDGEHRYTSTAEPMALDILVVSGSPKLSIDDLMKVFDIGMIVFDDSNPLWKIEQWQKDCEAVHLRCHSVHADGAFILDASPASKAHF